jgi:hypothetical protein
VRFALRQLLRTPSFTAIAVLTLAVGIATNTTIFAIVDEIALKPARGIADDRVFHLHGAAGSGIQIPDYELLIAAPPEGIAAIAAYDTWGGGVAQIPGRAERISGWRVTGQYARVHAVRAQVGRWIDDNDNTGGATDPALTLGGMTRQLVRGTLGADVAVVSDRLWREWFDSDRRVAEGATITIDRRAIRIFGVAPPGFEPNIDVWQPFGRRRLLTRAELELTRRSAIPRCEHRSRENPTPPQREFEPTQPELQVQVRTQGDASRDELNGRLTAAVSGRPASIESPRGPMTLVPAPGRHAAAHHGLHDSWIRGARVHCRLRESRQHALRTRHGARGRNGDATRTGRHDAPGLSRAVQRNAADLRSGIGWPASRWRPAGSSCLQTPSRRFTRTTGAASASI